MQKQAKQFIELLVSQQLLAPEIVEELRRQVSESKTRLTPELLAKLLVDNGHLTKFQATKLIAEVRDSDEPSDASNSEEELGFAPEVEEVAVQKPAPEKKSKQPSKPGKPTVAVAAVFVDDAPVEEAEVAEVVEVEPLDVVPAVGAVEVVATSVEPVDVDGAFEDVPRPLSKVVKAKQAKANPFDSFRILGIGLILAVVAVAGFFLLRHLIRGNADQRLKAADAAYEQRSYETAAKMYQGFASDFTTDDRVSYAKVRAALSLLRKEAETTPDPIVGLRTALEVLPPISGESALSEQQSDLAGALIGLAGKFNERADRTETTSDRKLLMNEMDKLLELIDNPQFVGTAQKDQQAPTLQRIYEDRKRIQRDINRDEELASALTQMDAQLATENVLGAYRVRKELTDRYPVLRNNSELLKRIRQATAIQRALVVPSKRNIQLQEDGIAPEVGGRVVLANRMGGTAPDLAGKNVYVKVKGSVYAVDGERGKVLWRRFIGREFMSEPIRLDATGQSDVVVCDPELGIVSRLDGPTGDTLWSAGLGTPAHMPSIEADDLLVATFDGTIANLDNQGGQTKWAMQLPQTVPVRPGVAFGKPNLYVPGEHSNLYVISRRDGSCKQVYYLDSRKGAIAVPPLLLLGQLFVFENRSSESASIRVFETDDEGLIESESTSYFQMSGNIVVEPQVDGRRLIVQSDVGECLVLDVEPTADTRKVSELARTPRSSFKPQMSWLISENNKVWIADARFTRLDLQVTLQKLTRAWVTDDGDTFTGPPQKFGDTIIHTRTLRGNRGARVAAVDADSGKPLWETDLGVPVTFISQTGNAAFDVVNSGGAVFAFTGQRLVDEASENPARGRSATLFRDPVSMGPSSAVLFNASNPNQLAHYTREGKRLRLLSAGFGSGAPSGSAIAVGENFGVGLDNGQFVIIDPSSGAQASAAYQVPLRPGHKVQWNTPVYIESSKTLIVAGSFQKLARLSVGPALRALTELELENPLIGPLTLVGASIAGVESTSAGDNLLLFDATSLAPGASRMLEGRRIAGPFAVDQDCVVQTNSKLMRIADSGDVVWAIDFPNSELVARPLAVETRLVLATRMGELWVVDAQTGELLGKTETRQAFTSAPLVHAQGYLLGSDEGTVLALPTPTLTQEGR